MPHCSVSGAPEHRVRSSINSSANCLVTVEIEWRRFKWGHVDDLERLDAGRPDVGVRPVIVSDHPETAQRLSESWGSINRKTPAWGSLFWYFWHPWHPSEPKETTPTHLHHWFIIIVRLEVIPSTFAWVIASSGTWGPLWLESSCYSWWLPPPRWLGAAEELRHMLVIVCGRLRWLWGVLHLPRRSVVR
jgi:hypothetical protein